LKKDKAVKDDTKKSLTAAMDEFKTIFEVSKKA
jgi:hypothetical protein